MFYLCAASTETVVANDSLFEIMMAVFWWLTQIVGLLADCAGAALGGYGIYTLITQRKHIPALFGAISLFILNEKFRKIKNSLGRLEAIEYNTKKNKREIDAVIGELSGSLVVLSKKCPSFTKVTEKLQSILNGELTLDETTKRSIAHELHALIDQEQGDNVLIHIKQ